jgi:hypothetical protein
MSIFIRRHGTRRSNIGDVCRLQQNLSYVTI